MAKRRSEEARVLAYFTSAPIEKAELMLGLVRDQVKQRIAAGEDQPFNLKKSMPAIRASRRRTRKAKAAQAGAGTQTTFDPLAMDRAQ